MKKISLLVLLLTVVSFVGCIKAEDVTIYEGFGTVMSVQGTSSFVFMLDNEAYLNVSDSPYAMSSSMRGTRWNLHYSIDASVQGSDGTYSFNVTCHEMDSLPMFPVMYLSDYTDSVVPDSVGTRSVQVAESVFAIDYLTILVAYGYNDNLKERNYTLVFEDSLFTSGSKVATATLYCATEDEKEAGKWGYAGYENITFDLGEKVTERLVELDTLIINNFEIGSNKDAIAVIEKYSGDQTTEQTY